MAAVQGQRPPPAGERVAARLSTGESRWPIRARTSAATALTELGQIDRAVYSAVAETPTPVLDPPLRRLSRAADRSRLWLGIAVAMAAVGGREGRRAACAGVAALAIDSAVVNIGFKLAAHRQRPDRDSAGVPALRQVPMPHSASFPSGHAASGFAFANAVGQTQPLAAAPLRLLASMVGYSRVHTGVHYPGDVVMGAVIGAAVGELVGWGLVRTRRPASARG
ncbi:MAG TPA: phosphatase PAP2 family protein [Micromonosporaceae bacterium]|nr:phosphatase PAP2 family protein [Micromonosporaceae bacterium]